MHTEIAERFRLRLKELGETLAAVSPALADVPLREGGWTRKQIVGHLLDSAANNRQRFVRAAIEGEYTGPGYEQDAWVAAHGYAQQSWDDLLRWWRAEHELLVAIVDRIPQERLGALCRVGEGSPVTLQFLIEDYIQHQEHHFEQITRRT
jgi:hypothetical protein